MSDKKKIVLTALITAVVTAFISVNLTSFVKDRIAIYLPSKDENKAFSNKMTAVEHMLSSNYLYDFDKTKLRDDAIKAYVDGLDEPYTHYYTQSEFSSYIDNIQDGYVGIGVIVGVNDDNQIEVVAPFEDSPAYNAGIQPSDIIKAIDGVEYSGDKLSEAVGNIKNGEIGTTVDIKILRGEEELDITVTRDDIATDSVDGEMLNDNIGYIRVTGFNTTSDNGEKSTFSEFKDKITELQSSGMSKMIIDLRDNPGGVLDEACNMADMILPEGIITYTETKSGKRTDYNSDAESLDIPIVILINENSASASEVFTGALKDYGKATVVGKKSYGKGIVQSVLPFYDGSGMSLTVAKYYTPNGTCIHGIGIEPDVEVDMPDEYKDMYASMVEHDKDTQLQKAIEIIKEK